ncbi:hypothetical protein [Algoriphagus sanaruensis]|uniref:hypothetical protein n=1 Tax=Algoriphagus sanaruensis TaxID=1727163 RepID=UPI000830035E|nr:hypothetical protein [Algoriphagus sanaruensis]
MRSIVVFLGILFNISFHSSTGWASTTHFYFTSNARETSKQWVLGEKDGAQLYLGQLDSLFKRKNYGIHVINQDGQWLAWQDCGFDLLVWDNGAWKNQYQFNNFGYTCSGTILNREGRLYLLGGKGPFHQHVDLIEFYSQFGSWELIPVEQQPLNYFSPWKSISDQGIFLLFGTFSSKRTDQFDFVNQGYFLDWNTNKWMSLKLNWKQNQDIPNVEQEISIFFDLQDYSIVKLQEGWFMLDKGLKRILFLEEAALPIQSSPDYFSISNNQLEWKIGNEPVSTLEISELIAQAKEVASIQIVPQVKEVAPKLRLQTLGILLAFFVVFGGLAYTFFKKRLTKKHSGNSAPFEFTTTSEKAPDPMEIWRQKLITAGKEFYTTEELDAFFEFDPEDTAENKRVKRSRLIKGINESAQKITGKSMIERERQPQDKRYFRYSIDLSS